MHLALFVQETASARKEIRADKADFPTNADSRMLLREVVKKVAEKGYSVGNADVTIVAQRPKMLPYIEQMRKNVADDLNVGIDDVNIKATTTEKLGFEGRGEGISATAVVLLK